ncbi:MAG TPA: crotonase/enoyl-CoA hydratase family protein [Acidimicrobiales bacterium]|nr:crotonase/enoyl-CoA hydratase family protein [Acidimicrobiales bacterium]
MGFEAKFQHETPEFRGKNPVTYLDYQLDDGIATVRLDDGKVNALSVDMQAAIGEAIDRAEADDAAIVLTGRPGVFSAGFDLAVIAAGGSETAAMVIGGFRLAERVLTYPRPVVVACTGHAIAMGTFLMFAGDYRIGPDAGTYKWIANEVAIGLTMPRAAIEMLRMRLTPAAIDRAVILSYQFGPADALASGYFDQLVPLDDVVDAALSVAKAALKLDARAHAASKLRTRAPALDALARAIRQDEEDFARFLGAD